jgi:hypothetical protein
VTESRPERGRFRLQRDDARPSGREQAIAFRELVFKLREPATTPTSSNVPIRPGEARFGQRRGDGGQVHLGQRAWRRYPLAPLRRPRAVVGAVCGNTTRASTSSDGAPR